MVLIEELDLNNRLDHFLNLESVKQEEYQLFKRRAKDIQQQMKDEEFRITVVGEFSAGKSTFLNALIGRDILPHANSETTASVTYIKNTPVTDKKCNTIKITFFDLDRKPIIYDLKTDPLLLRNYATTMSETMNVVKEVESITIYLDFAYTDDPIVFIDTPGLNGMADGHYERMLYEIQRAHASIYLFPVRGISKSNQQLFEILQQYQKSFIFVMNFIDELKAAEGETVESKITDFRSNLTLLGITEEVPAFGISALQALVARDGDMKYMYAGDTVELQEEDRAALLEKSRFSLLEDYLWNEIIKKEKDRVRQESYERKYSEMIMDFTKELDYMIDLHCAQLDSRQKDRVELRIKQLKEIKSPNIKRLHDFLLARQRELRKILQEDIQSQLETIQEKKSEEINNLQWRDFEQVEPLKEIEKNLGKQLVQLTQQKNTELTDLLISTYRSAIVRVNHYFPTIQMEQKDLQFTIQLGEFDQTTLNTLQGKIKKRKQETKELVQREQEQFEKLQEVQEKLGTEEVLVKSEKQKLQAAEDKRNKAFRALGKRPVVRMKVEIYQKKVTKKKIFGGIINYFGGNGYSSHYQEREREVKDDRAAVLWDEKRERIEKEYVDKSSRLTKGIVQLEKRFNQMNEQTITNQAQYQRIVHRLKNAKEEFEHAKREYQDVYSRHRDAYVQQQKQTMNQTVRKTLEELHNRLGDKISDAIEEGIQEMIPNVDLFYNEIYEKHLSNLQTLFRKISVNEQTEQVKILKQWKEEVESL